ncbi:MAG: hypothetical protein Q7U28_14050 [Aquabacterium sp.]|nr:hypothetical protein [Aquabacterium sp.]
MKLSKLMIAAIAACGVSHVMAAGVTRLTGSSASSVNVVRGAVNLCTTAGGTATVFKTTTATNALGNQFTVQCTADFDQTTVDELRVNVAGGSETAVLNAALFTGAGSAATNFLVPTGSCTALAAGTESLSFLAAGQMKNCGTTLADVGVKSDGGYLDEEGPVFNPAYDSTDFAPSGFSQVFGIAVNKTLYEDLQAYQKTVAGGSIVAAACAVGATTPECQPSVSRAQIASLVNASASNAAKTTGVTFLAPSSSVAGLTNKITYCKRPQTSGTQQAVQLYFLNYDGNGPLGGKEPVVGTVSLAKYASIENSGSSNVKACVNSTAAADGYRFGAISLENNPIGGSDTYRFVKLNEVSATEGVAGASNTATAIAGRYDFVYELSAYCPGGTCADILNALGTSITAGASSPGIFLTGIESKYGRGGNSAKGYAVR